MIRRIVHVIALLVLVVQGTFAANATVNEQSMPDCAGMHQADQDQADQCSCCDDCESIISCAAGCAALFTLPYSASAFFSGVDSNLGSPLIAPLHSLTHSPPNPPPIA